MNSPNQPGTAVMGRPSPPVGAPPTSPAPGRDAARSASPNQRKWIRGLGEPSASLHRPRQRKGGSGEGATQTVALSKLRPQFSQVCPSERCRVGAPLGDLPSRCGHPGMSWAPRPARREPTTKGAQGRESRSKEGGKAGAPACAHNEAAETHTFPPREQPREHPPSSAEVRRHGEP